MIFALALFVVGLAVLVKGADVFVEAAARFARILGVSELVIGLTLIAVGTSLPELSASVIAASSGNPELALGNALGSNIANLGVVLGVSAAVAPISVHPDVNASTLPFLVVLSLLALVFLKTGWKLERIEGGIFVLLYLGFMAWTVL